MILLARERKMKNDIFVIKAFITELTKYIRDYHGNIYSIEKIF